MLLRRRYSSVVSEAVIVTSSIYDAEQRVDVVCVRIPVGAYFLFYGFDFIWFFFNISIDETMKELSEVSIFSCFYYGLQTKKKQLTHYNDVEIPRRHDEQSW